MTTDITPTDLTMGLDAGGAGAWRPLTMQDIRLCAGEGKLSAATVLQAANALAARRFASMEVAIESAEKNQDIWHEIAIEQRDLLRRNPAPHAAQATGLTGRTLTIGASPAEQSAKPRESIDNSSLLQALEVAERALEPFAAYADRLAPVQDGHLICGMNGPGGEIKVTIGDMRSARQALSHIKNLTGEKT